MGSFSKSIIIFIKILRKKINNKLIDLYQLTMGQVYWRQGLPDATFSLFFRPTPKRLYFVLSGIDDLLDKIDEFRFDEEDLIYLESLKIFDKDYLRYLSTFRFDGLVRSMKNGSIFFPNESVLEITGNIIEGQILETLIINEVHSNTSLATKSTRIVQSSGNSTIVDFSARRTYGYEAALKASKNAYLAGFEGTSNFDAAKLFDIPVSGTMGHSYILGFQDEYQSFLNYAQEFKSNSIYLVDTFDSLEGVQKVIELHKNESLDIRGIRLDSGDFSTLSYKARKMLDSAGLKTTKIIVSGSMNEYKIHELINNQKCPIDIFGVGSDYGVSSDVPVLECVYKLVEIDNQPVNKNSPNKSYLPYSKQIYRKLHNNMMDHDIVTKNSAKKNGYFPMIKNIYDRGDYLINKESLHDVRKYIKIQMEQLPDNYKNLKSEKIYRVVFEI